MQGECGLCDEWAEDVMPCPKCGTTICIDCWYFAENCCIACHFDGEEPS